MVATSDGVFGFFHPNGYLTQYDLHSGEELKQFTEGIQVQPSQPENKRRTPFIPHSVTLSVNLTDDLVVQTYLDNMVALDPKTGKRIWQYGEKRSVLSIGMFW